MNKSVKIILSLMAALFVVGIGIVIVSGLLGTPNPDKAKTETPALIGIWQNGTFIISKGNIKLASINTKNKPESATSFNNGQMIAYAMDKRLYLFKNNETQEVDKYQPQTDTLQGQKFLGMGSIQFSPKGSYLLYNKNWEESYSGQIYNIGISKLLEQQKPNNLMFHLESNLFWNSNEKCVINIVEPGMFGPGIDLIKVSNKAIVSSFAGMGSDELPLFFAKDGGPVEYAVYWKNDCSGIVKNMTSNIQYKFDSNGKKAINQLTNLADYAPSLIVDQQLITISP